jgi:hypothetical protein
MSNRHYPKSVHSNKDHPPGAAKPCHSYERLTAEDMTDKSGELKMERKHILAAEMFSYSFENYRNHLGIGHDRFETIMPQDAALLERAQSEQWPDERIAKKLEVDLDEIPRRRQKYMRAKSITDAVNPAESFRFGVRFSIQDALEKGINGSEDIEDLVSQICYRASDMAVLLELQKETLSKYSDTLRQEP